MSGVVVIEYAGWEDAYITRKLARFKCLVLLLNQPDVLPDGFCKGILLTTDAVATAAALTAQRRVLVFAGRYRIGLQDDHLEPIDGLVELAATYRSELAGISKSSTSGLSRRGLLPYGTRKKVIEPITEKAVERITPEVMNDINRLVEQCWIQDHYFRAGNW